MRRTIERVKGALMQRIAGMVQRVVLQSLTNSEGIQLVSVRGIGGNIRKTAERFEAAGLTSYPTEGEGVQFAVNGNTDHPVVLGLVNRLKRPTNGVAGETQLYNEFDSEVHLKADGTIELHAGGAVDFVALAAKVKSEMDTFRALYDAHIHVTTATVGVGPVGVIAPTVSTAGPSTTTAADKVKAE